MSGSGAEIGYRVEARVDKICITNPVTLTDGILTTEWREVRFTEDINTAVVPADYGPMPNSMHYTGNLLPYSSAIALAWTIVAQYPFSGVQCRLVQYRVKYTYEVTRMGEVDDPVVESRWIDRLSIKQPTARASEDKAKVVEPDAE